MADASEMARSARAGTGMTQREFAKLLGLSPITVSLWETGNRRPSKRALSLLCLVELLGMKSVSRLQECHAASGRSVVCA